MGGALLYDEFAIVWDFSILFIVYTTEKQILAVNLFSKAKSPVQNYAFRSYDFV